MVVERLGIQKLILGVALFVSVFMQNAQVCKSEDVLILVHGLGGWGEDEFLGFPYWSYKDVLEEGGLVAKAAKVGKFTSNWDRAVELYAQIKGTVVDYGFCHAQTYDHLQFGENFTGRGLYPEWDENHRIHLMGHSMGGQTMKMLEYLLQEGSGINCPQDTSPLLTGSNRNWIRSITSISGTLDGTTTANSDFLGDFVRNLVIGLNVVSRGNFIEDLYDVDMPQWGLVRQEGESFTDYWNRAYDAGIANPDNLDFSLYDLSTEGARVINERGQPTYPNTYYFAIATERTNPVKICFLFWCETYQVPDAAMIPFLWLTASAMGSTDTAAEDRENDGLVNWHRQICPTNSGSDQTKSNCIEYKETWTPSQWHYLDVSTLDHLQIILRNTLTDIFNYKDGPKKIYTEHALRLKALPPDGSASVSVVADDESENSDLFKSLQSSARFSESSKKDDRKRKAGIVVNVMVAVALFGLVAFGGFYAYKRQNKKSEDNEVKKRSSVSHYIYDEIEPAPKRKSVMDVIRSSLTIAKPEVDNDVEVADEESGIMSNVRKSLAVSVTAQVDNIGKHPL